MFRSRGRASKIFRFAILSSFALITSSCASSNGPLTVANGDKMAPTIDYEFVGIPFLYHGFGSSVPITRDLSLTAAHVARVNWDDVIAYHPRCDIAIIRADNRLARKLPDLGLIHTNEDMTVSVHQAPIDRKSVTLST